MKSIFIEFGWKEQETNNNKLKCFMFTKKYIAYSNFSGYKEWVIYKVTNKNLTELCSNVKTKEELLDVMIKNKINKELCREVLIENITDKY
jgi:hypothetical protein